MANTTGDNNYGVAKFIVDPTLGQGTHTTIAAAIASASSGDTIFVRPATYTENLTLKAGVNIAAFEGDAFVPNVTIVGKCSYSSAGSTCISNIRLQTNSDFLLEVTGAVASIVTLTNCYLNIANNTAISFASSNAGSLLQLLYCQGNILTTGIAVIAQSCPGEVFFNYTQIGNGGNSTTASTVSAGALAFQNSYFVSPFSTSATGTLFIDASNINTEPTNTITLTCNGTTNHVIAGSKFSAGTASCISVGAGAVVTANLCVLNGSNAHAIDGAGTANYSSLALPSGGDINAGTTNKTNFYAGTVL